MTQQNSCGELDLGALPDGWQEQGLVVWVAAPPAEHVNITFSHEPRGSRTLESIVAEARGAIKRLGLVDLQITDEGATTYAGMQAHRFTMVHRADAKGRLLLRMTVVAVSSTRAYSITATAPKVHEASYAEMLENLLSQVKQMAGI